MSHDAETSGPRLGDELRAKRLAAGLSLRGVERESGINSGYLSQLERNEIANPSPALLLKVANAYGLPMQLLMQWAGYIEEGLSVNAQRALSALGDDFTDHELEAMQAVLGAIRARSAAGFDPASEHRTDLILPTVELEQVRTTAIALLRETDQHKGERPVDLDAAMQAAKLVEAGELELTAQERSFLRKQFGSLVDVGEAALKRVLGLVHLDRNEVYLSPDLGEAKRRFVKAHEIGHSSLEDHRIALAYVDDTSRLKQTHHDRFERQANQFAIELLAKGPLMVADFDSSPLSVAAIEVMAAKYSVSLQAVARRLAEDSARECAVAVAYRTHAGNGSLLPASTKLWASKSFDRRFPDCRRQWQQALQDLVTSDGEGPIPGFSAFDVKERLVGLQCERKDSRRAVFVMVSPERRSLRQRVRASTAPA